MVQWNEALSRFLSNISAKATATKTYLVSHFQYLLSNAKLLEKQFKRTQNNINKYVNKKLMIKTATHYLKFSDCGTLALHLYTQYLATKVAWISR